MKNESENQLYALEAHLAGTLKPVTPPIDLVQRMRSRIRFPQPKDINWQIGNWRRLFVVYGSVMSGLLVTITVARAFFYFFRRDI
jgi:hypothetical protein